MQYRSSRMQSQGPKKASVTKHGAASLNADTSTTYNVGGTVTNKKRRAPLGVAVLRHKKKIITRNVEKSVESLDKIDRSSVDTTRTTASKMGEPKVVPKRKKRVRRTKSLANRVKKTEHKPKEKPLPNGLKNFTMGLVEKELGDLKSKNKRSPIRNMDRTINYLLENFPDKQNKKCKSVRSESLRVGVQEYVKTNLCRKVKKPKRKPTVEKLPQSSDPKSSDPKYAKPLSTIAENKEFCNDPRVQECLEVKRRRVDSTPAIRSNRRSSNYSIWSYNSEEDEYNLPRYAVSATIRSPFGTSNFEKRTRRSSTTNSMGKATKVAMSKEQIRYPYGIRESNTPNTKTKQQKGTRYTKKKVK